MLFRSVFQSNWQGLVYAKGPLDQADFSRQLVLLGLSPGLQDEINSIASGKVYVFSNLGVPEGFAETDWGMELHDGDKMDESNEVVFRRFADVTDKLIVRVLINSRDRGFADWQGLKKCLTSYTPSPGGSAGYSPAQLDQIEAELKSTGISKVTPINGSEGAMVICVSKHSYQP